MCDDVMIRSCDPLQQVSLLLTEEKPSEENEMISSGTFTSVSVYY